MTASNIITLLLLCWLPFNGLSQERIIWYESIASKKVLNQNASKRREVLNGIKKSIADRLTKYEHVTKTSNFLRMLKQIKNKNNACSISLFKNKEREAFTVFSVPMYIFFF